MSIGLGGRLDVGKSGESVRGTKDASAPPKKDLVRTSLENALKSIFKTIAGAETAAGTNFVSQLLDAAVDAFPAGGATKDALKVGKDIVFNVIQSVAKDPPTASDPNEEARVRYLSKIVDPVVDAGDGKWKVRDPKTFLAEMLRRF